MALDLWLADVRLAWRNACRRPAFTLLVVLTLGVGFGAVSAVFALADAVLLQPLPYPQPDRLVYLWQTLPRHDVFSLETTPADYQYWKELKAFAGVGLVDPDTYTLTGTSEAERVHGARVTASVLPLLGLAPRVGRAFGPDEDDDAAPATAILGDGLWRRRFGADPAVVGRSLVVDGVPREVVGIMPAGATLPGSAIGTELWLPMRFDPAERTNTISHNYTAIGRLAAGVSVAQASDRLSRDAEQMAVRQPETHAGLGARAESIATATTATIRPALAVLLGGVVLLLLIASANVATLLVVRAAGRRRESAIRGALGATAARLLALALAETMLLALAGGACGIVLGDWGLRALLPLFGGSLPRAADAHVGVRAALLTLAAATGLGLALAAVAARVLHADRLSESLAGGTRASAPPRVARARSLLVVGQVALSVVLLTASALMLESVVRLAHVRPGFSPEHLLTLRLSLPDAHYAEPARRTAFAEALVASLDATPGVVRAAISSFVPFGGGRGANSFEIEGEPATPGAQRIADQRHVTPDYFRTMRIPLLRGRAFTSADDARAEPVAIVNRTMAERAWPGADPIDRRVRLEAGFDAKGWIRIVGVVDDVHHVSLSRPPVMEMYRPYAQAAARDFVVVVKTAGDPTAAGRSCRAAVDALDRNLPVYDVRTMTERLARSLAGTRATTLLLLVTAIVAALLAAVAIDGSISYSVSERTPEIGIRLALGATRGSICGQVIGQALRLSAMGALAGTAAALMAGRLLSGLLFETRVADPATFAAIAGTVFGLTAAASLAPARRAMRVDPVAALKQAQ